MMHKVKHYYRKKHYQIFLRVYMNGKYQFGGDYTQEIENKKSKWRNMKVAKVYRTSANPYMIIKSNLDNFELIIHQEDNNKILSKEEVKELHNFEVLEYGN